VGLGLNFLLASGATGMDNAGSGTTQKLNDVLPPSLAQGFDARGIHGIISRVYDYYDAFSCCLALEAPTGMVILAGYGIDAKFVEHPPSGKSLLYHGVNRNLPIIIYNAAQDPRYCQDPLVVGPPFVRFFVGVPLMLTPTTCIGTVCIMDKQEKTFYSLQDCQYAMHAANELMRYYMESGRTAHYWSLTSNTLGTVPSLSNLPPMVFATEDSVPSTPETTPPTTPRSCTSEVPNQRVQCDLQDIGCQPPVLSVATLGLYSMLQLKHKASGVDPGQ